VGRPALSGPLAHLAHEARDVGGGARPRLDCGSGGSGLAGDPLREREHGDLHPGVPSL
jgi:hypothetical protein